MSASNSWDDNPAATTDEVAEMLQNVSSEHGRGPVEAFLRSSTVRKIELDGSTGDAVSSVGREQGGALRWVDPRDETSGFAAASGDGVPSLARCRSIANRTPGRPLSGCPWNEAADPGEDADWAHGIPEIEEMDAWLRESAPEGLDWARLEAGKVRETWLIGPETVQVRLRTRIWAVWMPMNDPPAARPLIHASRSWADLTRRDPIASWRERTTEPDPDHPWPDDAQLVFSPETSAFLVHLLARVEHNTAVEPGRAVGRGWVLRTGGPETLFGSDFDDAGFPVGKRILADGRHVLGSWGGEGQLRRASFRDIPEPTPSSLVLEPPRIDPPKRAVWVTRADVHPSGDSWSIRLEGRRYPDGAGFRPFWKRASPGFLIDACLGGIGPAHESHLGVVTPALVFDSLLLD